MSEPNYPTTSTQTPRRWTGVVAGVVVLVALLAIGYLPRMHGQQQPAYATAESQLPTVAVISPRRPPRADHVTLPGNAQAIQQTTLNAQVTGYVKQVYVDIGDKVTSGQVLATIATPVNDQMLIQAQAQEVQANDGVTQARAQLAAAQGSRQEAAAQLLKSIAGVAQANSAVAQTQAQLAQAKQQAAEQGAQLKLAEANLNLAKVTNDRQQKLVAEGYVAKQTADQTEAAYETSQATVESAKASYAASKSNIEALQASVSAAQQNVDAAKYGVDSSKAAVASADSTVSSNQAAVAEASANMESSQANVLRYAAQQQFQNIVAPFDGVVTARYIDVGAMVTGTVGTSTGTASSSPTALSIAAPPAGGGSGALFSIARTNKVRIYVNVPQDYAMGVLPGQKADVKISQLPRAHLVGAVARTSGALDPASRTLLTEVDIDNSTGKIHPGVFAEVTLTVPRGKGALIVPDNAIVTNASNTQVVEVLPNNTIHYQNVTVGRDYGQTLELTGGVRSTNSIVLNPLESLQEGQRVQTTPGQFPQLKSKS
jgi:multidrug efflux pump subunit AcrA (membrane-fusion protein)